MRLRSLGSRPIAPVDLARGRCGEAPAQRQIGAVQIAGRERGGRARSAPPRSWRPPSRRRCPCRAGGRCRAASRRRCPGRRVAAMGEQGVDQRAILVARRRMHDQPGRLVQHDQVGVFVKNGERIACAPGRRRQRERECQHIARAAPDRLGGLLQRDSVAACQPFRISDLTRDARKVAAGFGEEAVGPLALRLRSGDHGKGSEEGAPRPTSTTL